MRKKILFFSFLIAALASLTNAAVPLPTNVTVLTRDDFNGQNFFSVADALEDLTAINIERDGYRGTRAVAKIRGTSSATRVLVLIDGRPIQHEFNSEVDLSQIPLSFVERIEINTGGASSSYSGEAIAGVIHIITVRPGAKGFTARLDSGVGRDGVKYSGGRLRGRSYIGDLTYAGSLQRSSGFLFNEELKNENHFGNISRSFNGKGFWSVDYFFEESRIGLPNGTQLPFNQWDRRKERQPAILDPVREQELQYVRATLQSPDTGLGRFSGHVTYSFRQREDLTSRTGLAFFDQESTAVTWDAKWEKENWELGGRVQEFDRLVFPNPEKEVFQSSAYLLHRFGGKSWTALPSLRFEHHSKFGGLLLPRLVLVKAWNNAWTLSGTVSRGFRAPTMNELFLGTAANVNLDPEDAWTYDTGVAFQPSDQSRFAVTGFYTRIRDLIQTDSNTAQRVNRGKEETAGVETQVAWEGGKGKAYRHIKIDGSWTYQRSKKDLRQGAGFVSSALTPRHVALARLFYYFPRHVTVVNEFRYQSEQFSQENDAGLRLASAPVWTIRIKLKILKALFYFDIENVLARRYADTVTSGNLSPQSERTIYSGFSIRLDN